MRDQLTQVHQIIFSAQNEGVAFSSVCDSSTDVLLKGNTADVCCGSMPTLQGRCLLWLQHYNKHHLHVVYKTRHCEDITCSFTVLFHDTVFGLWMTV